MTNAIKAATRADDRVGRRHVLMVGGAAIAATVATSVHSSRAALAANGDPLILGQANSSTGQTQLTGPIYLSNVQTGTLVANGLGDADPAASILQNGPAVQLTGSFTPPPEALRVTAATVLVGGNSSGRAGHGIVATGGKGSQGTGNNPRDVQGGTGLIATGGDGFATGNPVTFTPPVPTAGGAGIVATGGAGFAGGVSGIGASGSSLSNVGVLGHSDSGIGVLAETSTGAIALSATGGRVMVTDTNAEYRLVGQEPNGRTWRLFSDGTSFAFRDETGAQNILLVATDAVQFTKRLLPVGDAVPGMDLGIVGARWASVRAANVFSGDLHFENGYRISEEPYDGLAFFNGRDERIAVLDGDGNLRIRGRVIEGL